MLAATWGRLYSSAFYALRDTRTPLYFAIVRVVLTGALGVLFAFPLRWLLSDVMSQGLHLATPALPQIERGMGVVGLTFSAGLSGWIEFLLLRRALQARIGSTELPRFYATKIWLAALVAGAAGWGAGHFIHLGIRWANLGVVLAAFGIVYGGLALLLRVPQAQALLLRKRSR
jgi:putative peptidoglycan lipid II flippase